MSTVTKTRKNPSAKLTAANRLNGDSGNLNGNGTNGHSFPAPAPSVPQKPCAAEVELLVQQMERLSSEAKERYAASDVIEQKLIAMLAGGKTNLDALAVLAARQADSVTLSDGRTVKLTSKFFSADGSTKPKGWGMAGIQAVEIVVK